MERDESRRTVGLQGGARLILDDRKETTGDIGWDCGGDVVREAFGLLQCSEV